jgi:hypothetical protein
MGNNAGRTGGNTGSKRTIQVRQEKQQPLITETITGGRVVGGAFGGAGSGGGRDLNKCIFFRNSIFVFKVYVTSI